MAAATKDDKKLTEKTLKLTKEYVELLNEWEPKRRATVARIKDIATDLRNTKQNVNIAQVVGASVGIVGGVAAVAGTVLTGGLAAPLCIGGVASAIAGSATSAGAGITEYLISKDKLESAQALLNDDKKLTQKVEQKKNMIDGKIKRLSSTLNMSNDEVFGMMLMTTVQGTGFADMNELKTFNLLMSKGLVKMTTLALRGRPFCKSIATLSEVSLGGLSRVFGSVLKGFAKGVGIAFDIYALVTHSIDLARGSPSDAADSLSEVARKLEEQANQIKKVLKQLREQSEEYETEIRKKFRELLEKVADQKCASDEDKKEIFDFICLYACHDWQDAYTKHGVNLHTLLHGIARVIRNFMTSIEDYMKNTNRARHFDITLIAHGRIDALAPVPCQLYYLTNNLNSITCYSPWGCAVDAKVIYGIATNTLQIPNVQYSSNQFHPRRPFNFNILPRSLDLTPNVIFSPVLHGEGAHQALLQLISILQDPADGLVIPYFTDIGNDLPPFTDMPLWACAISVAICATFFKISVNLRIAACLSPEDVSKIVHLLQSDGFFPNLNQYCQVPMNRKPPESMTNQMTYPQRIRLVLNAIQGYLFL